MAKNIELSVNLKKYYSIMNRYYNGEFGNEHLTMKEILKNAGEENLFKEMNTREIEYLINHSSGFIKLMFLDIQKRKLEETKESIKSISLEEDSLKR